MTQVKDMTEGRVGKVLVAFYIPIFFTNMLQQLYTFVDTAIVGKGLGRTSLAAVGNMGSICFLIVGFSIGLANGFSVLIAQSFGAKDPKRLKQTLGASVKLAAIVCVILTLFSMLGLRGILNLLQTDPSVMGESLIYGYIIFGGLIFTISYNMCACILRALGDSRTPLKAIVASSVLNLGLDCLFIFVFGMGVAGAAIATIFSQFISTLICLKKIMSIEVCRLKKENYKNSWGMYGNLLKNGIPMAFMNSITAIGCMVVQYFVNGFGVACTAAYSACSKYLNLFMQPACTAGHTISAFTGQNSGAGRYDRVKNGLMVCAAIATIAYLILGSVMFFMPEGLARVILSDDLSVSYAVKFLPICGMMLWAVDYLFVFRSALQGMGNPLVPMISGIVEMVVRVGIIILFSSDLGFIATAFAEAGAWTGAFLLNVVALFVQLKKNGCTFGRLHLPRRRSLLPLEKI